MMGLILIIGAICNNSFDVVVIDKTYYNEQETLVTDVDFNILTPSYENLRDIIAGDEVFVLSPYQLVQYLPYFMQVEPTVQEIVQSHLKMNFKFRNKNFAISKKFTGHLRRRGVLLYVFII